jgi:SSS family solute:Na+ symporter
MGFHWIDWVIVGCVIAGMIGIAWGTRRLMRSVADFLAANRSAGRYLLTMASGMAGLGAISIAASYEQFFEAGFAGVWWGQMLAPVMLILALSGFVIYRFRETRALTMAQFFEMRYSRRFRIFSGLLAFVSGLLNYGIFPAVTARFLIYFIGLPPEIDLGFLTIPTLAPVMALMLGLALTLTLSGGQVAVMITDFFQGQFVQIVSLVIFFYLLTQVGWSGLMDGLQLAPTGESKLDPFDQSNIPDFNVGFFLMTIFISVYGFKAWQGSQGYNAAPKNPHEAKMAGILGEFRAQVVFLLSMLVPVFVYAMLQLPEFSGMAADTRTLLGQIEAEQIQTQMRVPVGLSAMLPVGLMGLFASVIVMAAVSTDDTYLHSWGSIFIQDVVMPFRKTPLSQKAHLRLLRSAIVGVAIFAFFFSLLFPLNEYIFMYFQITGAIFLGGAGAVIIGGLYWKRGTVEGAWAAMITGSVLAVTAVSLRNIVWPFVLPGMKLQNPELAWLQALPTEFPFNGTQMAFGSSIAAVCVYVLGSLLSKRPPANMDKLLHRGAYAVESEGHHPQNKPFAGGGEASFKERFWRRLGVNKDFTRGDKAIYIFQILWTLFFFAVFVIGTIFGLAGKISLDLWTKWWALHVTLVTVVGILATIWFLIGGFRDLFDLIRTLKTVERDADDDGSVALATAEVEEIGHPLPLDPKQPTNNE